MDIQFGFFFIEWQNACIEGELWVENCLYVEGEIFSFAMSVFYCCHKWMICYLYITKIDVGEKALIKDVCALVCCFGNEKFFGWFVVFSLENLYKRD